MTSAPTRQTPPADIKRAIRERALSDGFSAAGFTDADADPNDRAALAKFLNAGWHGSMAWMDRDDGRRGDPKALMPGAKTIIALGMNYGPGDDPLEILEHKDRGGISVYARGRDYHDVLKKRLKKLGRWIAETYGADIKVFVDTAPVMEKPAAERAGIGWRGKHTNLVSRAHGSWLFLGEIFTDLALPADTPEMDHCGSCDRCLRVCPTEAFPDAYQLDARRCISYLTIEHPGDIDDELMDAMGNRIYGCDDCLAVCPWTKFGAPTDEPALQPKIELREPRLADLAKLDDTAFRKFFSGSPIKRTGRDRFVRNVLIAIGNAEDPSLTPVAQSLVDDPAPEVAHAAERAVRLLSSA